MDHMLPSPGFSIPSIGTPVQPSGEDDLMPNSASSIHQQQNAANSQNVFGSSGMTPHSLIQPQTPVSIWKIAI